jgi:hypothetical protein
MVRIAIFAWGILVLMQVTDCAHHKSVPVPPTAEIPGVQAVSLGSVGISQLAFNIVVDDTVTAWAKMFPEKDLDSAYSIFQDYPMAFLLVDGRIHCQHNPENAQWPGDIPLCGGLWHIGSRHIIVQATAGDRLECTPISHELSHVLSWHFLGNADAGHKNKKVWKGIVDVLQKDCK